MIAGLRLVTRRTRRLNCVTRSFALLQKPSVRPVTRLESRSARRSSPAPPPTCCWPWSGRGRLPLYLSAAASRRSGRSPARHLSPLVERARGPVHHRPGGTPRSSGRCRRAGAHRTRRRTVAHQQRPIQLLGGSPLLAYNLLLIASVWWSGLGTARARSSAHRQPAGGARAPASRSRWRRIARVSSVTCSSTRAGGCPSRSGPCTPTSRPGDGRWLLVFGRVVAAAGAHEWVSAALLSVADCRLDRLVHARGGRTPDAAVAILATWVVFSLPLVPVLSQYLRIQTQLGLERNRAEMIFFSADWSSFLSATPVLRFWHTLVPPTTEGLSLPRPDRRRARARWRRRRACASRVFWFYVAARDGHGRTLLRTSGHARSRRRALWHPYEWLMWLPGFSGLRVPARFFLLTTTVSLSRGGLAVAHLTARFRHQASARHAWSSPDSGSMARSRPCRWVFRPGGWPTSNVAGGCCRCRSTICGCRSGRCISRCPIG